MEPTPHAGEPQSLNHWTVREIPRVEILQCVSLPYLCISLFCSVVHQAPLSMGLSSQEYWSGLSFPTPGNLANPGIKLTSPSLAGGFFTAVHQGRPTCLCYRLGNSWLYWVSFDSWVSVVRGWGPLYYLRLHWGSPKWLNFSENTIAATSSTL